MGDEKEKDSPSWIGHPMSSYIGAPLQAVVESSIMSVKSTVDFIEDVGTKTAEDGKIVPRNIPFVYTRVGYDPKNEESYTEKVCIEVPLLSLVKVPNIEIRKIDYSFSLEVKSVSTSSSPDHTIKKTGKPQALKAPIPKLYGVMSPVHEQARRTDKSTKMQVNIQAEKAETPEGMARIMDLMNQAITPRPIERTPLSAKSSEDDGSLSLDIDALSDADIQKLYEKLKRYNSK